MELNSDLVFSFLTTTSDKLLCLCAGVKTALAESRKGMLIRKCLSFELALCQLCRLDNCIRYVHSSNQKKCKSSVLEMKNIILPLYSCLLLFYLTVRDRVELKNYKQCSFISLGLITFSFD